MTTEFVLILGLFVFVVAGVFLGENGPRSVFARSGPRLGAHVERSLVTGGGFNFPQNNFEIPPGGVPSGTP